MKPYMIKTVLAGIVLSSLLILAGNIVMAADNGDSSSIPKTGNGSENLNQMPPGGGGIEGILEKAVSDQVITQETAEKIKTYLKDTEEARKEELEEIQSLSDDERKAYMEQHKQEKNNLFDELVAEGILTQSQADTMSKMLPTNNGQMSKPPEQPQNSDSQSKIKVIINGSEKSFSPVPVNKEGNVLVPMRSFFEALGCEVKWDEGTKTVIGLKSGTEVKLTINQKNAYVNNQTKSLTSAAQIINGSTFIPLRFVGEALGADVLWKDGTITITTQ